MPHGSAWASVSALLILCAACGGQGRVDSRRDAAADAGRDKSPSGGDSGSDARDSAGSSDAADAPRLDAGGGGVGDAAGGAPFILMVTESPPGPDNGNKANWGGVRVYFVRGTGAALEPIDGIPAAAVADPVGLAFRSSSSEVFVSNRHGNNSADGIAGSISRFVFDPQTRKLTPNGTITGNGLSGVHQAAFNPVGGELFAVNVAGGISRFTFDAAGNAVPNGVIATGQGRGVAVSADGTRLYLSSGTPVLQQFALPAGTELGRVSVGAGNAALHHFAQRGSELYLAGLTDNLIHRLAVSATNDLTDVGTVTASSAVAVTFSADALEMFAVGHRDAHVISRFVTDAGSATWTATAVIDVTYSAGGALVIAGGAPAVVGPPGGR